MLLIVCAALLVGLSQIGVVFKKAHQALINSRHLAFQTAYQQEITPALFPPYPIQSANHLDNILQPSATTFSSEKEMALITHSPTQSLSSSTTEKASSKSSKIQRHTTLLIDSYADKRPVMPLITTDVYLRASHLFPQSSHFPHVFSLEFEQLLKKIEGDLAVPSLATS